MTENVRVIDAKDAILGRLCSIVAKRLLEGEFIHIVNAEKAVVSGRKGAIISEYKRRNEIRTLSNPRKGPFHPKRPDTLLKRTVRGMLPWKKPKGKQAFKRLRVHIGVPEDLSSYSFERIEEADKKRLRCKYITLGELCRELGWNA
ncbi:MAG: 50S ribosomal protein L13 [Candidatus Asgardarchaeia archaeon]